MTMNDIRKILALQAVEEADENQAILNEEDYREAAGVAGAPLPKEVDTSGENRFLEKRADKLLVRATSRFPKAMQWANQSPSRQRLAIFAIVLFLVAAAIGFLTNELGPEKKINILSFPLLGIILWSFIIYLRDLFLLFRKPGPLPEGSRTAGIIDLLQPPHPEPAPANSTEETTLQGARVIFQKRWRKLNVPAIAARLKSILHTTALILALSAIAGMYVKGLANEYRAVWESTFFSNGGDLRPFLQVVLGPAIALTSKAIPSAEALELIHWQSGKSEIAGDNAKWWIHWYAITIALFVIIPRGILAMIWRFKANRIERTLPFRSVSPDYFDHLLAVSTGSTFSVTLVPYPITPEENSRRQLLRSLQDHFEKPIEVEWTEPVAFGEEEEAIDGLEGEVIPIFNFAATPEKETHLALYQTLLNQASDPVQYVILDTHTFEKKTGNLADAEDRLQTRWTAWRNLFEETKVEFITHSIPPHLQTHS